MAFQCEAFGLREAGQITEAAALAKAHVGKSDIPDWGRNPAIDILKPNWI